MHKYFVLILCKMHCLFGWRRDRNDYCCPFRRKMRRQRTNDRQDRSLRRKFAQIDDFLVKLMRRAVKIL